jgi:2-polyprenyl-3-methyl-5-hydroxy-6-metoxy-1,4-benzoquinol methylase
MKENYYDDEYFAWQKKMGIFGGKKNASKFRKYLHKESEVLDFGCGGGYLLANIDVKMKIGVEINDVARNQAIKNGVEAFKYCAEVPDNYCDVIISNHALEHVFNPFEELKSLKRILKPMGKIVFVVPNEKSKKFDKNDINKHLYTWTAMNLGNLFEAVGFDVIQVSELHHRWPPFYLSIDRFFGSYIFELACILYSYLRPNLSQIRIVAIKNEE